MYHTGILVALLPIQLAANAPRKAAEDGPRAEAPDALVGDTGGVWNVGFGMV